LTWAFRASQGSLAIAPRPNAHSITVTTRAYRHPIDPNCCFYNTVVQKKMKADEERLYSEYAELSFK
jgi:hypothetical protein